MKASKDYRGGGGGGGGAPPKRDGSINWGQIAAGVLLVGAGLFLIGVEIAVGITATTVGGPVLSTLLGGTFSGMGVAAFFAIRFGTGLIKSGIQRGSIGGC
jgi:hypothetical protein